MDPKLTPCTLAALLIGANCFAAPAKETGPATWGTITYPLFANVRAEEGTLLLHFRIDEDLTADMGQWFQPKAKNDWNRFILASLRVSDKNGLTIFWKKMKRGKGMMWTANSFPGKLQNLTDRSGLSRGWNQGETHVVGYTWDREGFHTFWLDRKAAGRHRSGSPALGLGAVDHGKAKLTLGSRRGSAITLLAVHVLQTALDGTAVQQPCGKLFAMTDDTMLLDRFDCAPFEPDGQRQTRAVFISGFTEEAGGTPSKGCAFVQTDIGPGIRLYCPPAKP